MGRREGTTSADPLQHTQNLGRVREIDKLLRTVAPVKDIAHCPSSDAMCCNSSLLFSIHLCVCMCACVRAFCVRLYIVCVLWLRPGWLPGNTRQPQWRSCRFFLNKTNTHTNTQSWGPAGVTQTSKRTHTHCSMFSI